jgi:hypothetical protein
MDRYQGDIYRPMIPSQYELVDINKNAAEKASQPLVNDTNVESNTVNQPSGRKWLSWKVAIAAVALTGGLVGTAVGIAIWNAFSPGVDTSGITGENATIFNNATTPTTLMDRNTTILNNGTLPTTTAEEITSYLSSRLSDVTSTAFDVISSTYQQITEGISTSTAMPTKIADLKTTTSYRCTPEGQKKAIKMVEEKHGGMHSAEGINTYFEYIKDCPSISVTHSSK